MGLEEQVAEHLARGPLAGLVRAVYAGLHVLELLVEMVPGGLGLLPELGYGCARHRGSSFEWAIIVRPPALGAALVTTSDRRVPAARKIGRASCRERV